MTKNQAAVIRLRWNQRAYCIPCEHLTLELERNDQDEALSKYVCTLCGECVPATQELITARLCRD